MKRGNKNTLKFDLILTADWHLRDTIPVSRNNAFEEQQWQKLDFISKVQKEHNCPVLHSGDLFHHWKPSPYLLSKAMQRLPNQFYTIYGNHDLPNHNLDLAEKSGIYALEQAGVLHVLDDFQILNNIGVTAVHWEYEPPLLHEDSLSDRNLLIWHVMAYQGKSPWPGCTDPKAATLLRKYTKYDIIVTGHNHKTFTEKYEDSIIINPGSITRQTSKQIKHVPQIFGYVAATNTIHNIVLPYTIDAVKKPENIAKLQERDERIDAFVTKLQDSDWEADLDFEKNVEIYIKTNKIDKPIKQLIDKCISYE